MDVLSHKNAGHFYDNEERSEQKMRMKSLFSFFALRVAVATLRGDNVAMKRNCKRNFIKSKTSLALWYVFIVMFII